MMVIDASVLTDFLLGRPQALEALDREVSGHEHEPLHAPELIEPEFLSALRRLVRSGQLTDQRATEAAADMEDLRLLRYPHAPLRARVWELRHTLTASDATYLSLAEALGDCILLTGDHGLASHARQSLGHDRVRHVT